MFAALPSVCGGVAHVGTGGGTEEVDWLAGPSFPLIQGLIIGCKHWMSTGNTMVGLTQKKSLGVGEYLRSDNTRKGPRALVSLGTLGLHMER